jgi:hypothetical protein
MAADGWRRPLDSGLKDPSAPGQACWTVMRLAPPSTESS